jgi:hypothetical protein
MGRFDRFSILGMVLMTTSCVGTSEKAEGRVRIALFNIREFRTEKITQVDESGVGVNPQARAAAEIIQRVRPDILVLNEIDHDYGGEEEGLDLNARRFASAYLASGENAIGFSYSYAAPNNTGLLTGLDLDGNGHVATDEDRGSRIHGNDAFGYGTYPGEFSMVVLSRYPILSGEARTFQEFLWRDLPGHHIPPGHYSAEALEIFRLSSKSHWDLPVEIEGHRLHLFASHPTPQGFDGEEDKNGRRNFDEIKFWVEYLEQGEALYDDAGRFGGYGAAEPFLVIGDLNSRPLIAGDSEEGSFRTSIYDGIAAIAQLLEHPRIQDTGAVATSRGAEAASGDPPGPPGYPERSTAVFGGGVRVDYILPSVGLEVLGGGVFWPIQEDDPEGARWAEEASDHRLVWVDLALP